mmetsp:Transcript_53641/g.85297  ORF Transcript_53641/g.85297 Transcript_53641/m.85297 type:complete len:227 (+) Transcript_53641:164-844(+)
MTVRDCLACAFAESGPGDSEEVPDDPNIFNLRIFVSKDESISASTSFTIGSVLRVNATCRDFVPPLVIFLSSLPCDVKLSSTRAISVNKNLRRSTISFTVQALDPRNSKTTSMNSGKEMPDAGASLKIKSTKSTRPTGSTPTSSMAFAASGTRTSAVKSSLVIIKPSSTVHPKLLSNFSNFDFTASTFICSFSTADTTLTTSTNTPTNIFITVSDAHRMNTSSSTP